MTKNIAVKSKRSPKVAAKKPRARKRAGAKAVAPARSTSATVEARSPQWMSPEDFDLPELGPEIPARPRYFQPNANCSIVGAAFIRATTGMVRRRLRGKTAIALVVLVPNASWVEPVRKLFLGTFGNQWLARAWEASKTPSQRADHNTEIGSHLASGRQVLGVAVAIEALPDALTNAADLTIKIATPDGATISRAIRMFTGQRVLSELGPIASGLEFHDLVAAFRSGSSPSEIVERLQKAAATSMGSHTAERLPDLEEAVEYGPARSWGLDLARDVADFKLGLIAWEAIDRGAVLVSEPGCGKSLYARILAQKCGVPLVAFSVADLFATSAGFLDSVIKASRAMFAAAKSRANPCCLLFLDEIDAVGNRAKMSDHNSTWWTNFLTDFMLSLDNAVAGQRSGIIVLGATNNISGVDPAIMRPGRLERTIEIKRPDLAGTLNILRYHVDKSLPDFNLPDIAALMVGSTAAEIMMIVRGARRLARYAGRDLQRDDLLRSIAPTDDIEPDALRRICIHESAHAVGSLVVPSGALQRCAVGGNRGALGRTVIEFDETDLMTRESIERRVVVLLCGRTAELIIIGNAGLGCGGDEDSDMAIMTQLIATLHASSGLGDTLTYATSFRDALAAVRDDPALRAVVEKHLRSLQARAEVVVHQHRDAILAVAQQLQDRRHLSGDEVRRIFAATSPNKRMQSHNQRQET